jgi:hypothetical protein
MVGKLLTAGVLVATAGFGLTPAAGGSARPLASPQCGVTAECVWTFYNNAQHSQVVGGVTLNCQGHAVMWGEETAYETGPVTHAC